MVIIKQKWVSLGLAGAVLVLAGIFTVVTSANKPEPLIIKPAVDDSSEPTELVVDVSGAVEKPGVYRLAGGSRINDVLIAAGGLSAKADRDWCNQHLNLAQKLIDGVKIYIPEKGEALSVNPESALININTATAGELDTLAGVGPATAAKIIQARPYTTVAELLSKKVLTAKVYEAIKNKISVY